MVALWAVAIGDQFARGVPGVGCVSSLHQSVLPGGSMGNMGGIRPVL